MGLQQPVEIAEYVSIRYTERLAKAGIEPSAGRVGDAAIGPLSPLVQEAMTRILAKTINSPYKSEVIRCQGSWCTINEVECGTLK